MLHKSGLLVALVLLVADVASTYIMDDRNASISYSPLNKVSLASSSSFYDGTETWLGYDAAGECSTSDNCQISVPFTGLGITLYPAVGYALSFNISIDGMASSQSHFDGVYGCCNNAIPVFNFTIYDIQNLPFGNHVLVLRLLDTSGNLFNASVPGSVLFFDYAVVKDTATPSSPSPSPVPQSPSPSPILPSPHRRLGPALGGALGGTAALAIVVLARIYIRRRAHKGDPEDPDNPIIVSDKQEQPVIAAGLRHDSAPVSSFGEGSNTRAAVEYQLHAQHEVPLTAIPFTISTSHPPPHHTTPTPPTHEIPFTASTSHPPPPHETPAPPMPRSREEEESQFLARMYSLDVPAAEIARVADVMRARRQTGQAEDSGALLEDVNASHPPPYEL